MQEEVAEKMDELLTLIEVSDELKKLRNWEKSMRHPRSCTVAVKKP